MKQKPNNQNGRTSNNGGNRRHFAMIWPQRNENELRIRSSSRAVFSRRMFKRYSSETSSCSIFVTAVYQQHGFPSLKPKAQQDQARVAHRRLSDDALKKGVCSNQVPNTACALSPGPQGRISIHLHMATQQPLRVPDTCCCPSAGPIR